MSKILKVDNGNYSIKVSPGNDIILDTSRQSQAQGKVYVYGELIVSGNVTTIETSNTLIEDNIITLNHGEPNYGVTELTAGIEIDRGSGGFARLLWNETISDDVGGLTYEGAWSFTNNSMVWPINTNAILATGSLYVKTVDVLTVSGSGDYEERVINYVGGQVTLDPVTQTVFSETQDDDSIPNMRAVIDYFTWAINNSGISLISDNDTSVRTLDETTTSVPSKVAITVDNIEKVSIYGNRIEFPSIKIQENVISSLDSNSDLILQAPGTGAITVNDTLHITKTPHNDDATVDPVYRTTGVSIYAKNPGYGATGIYFINENNNPDEVISSKKALAYSMIF